MARIKRANRLEEHCRRIRQRRAAEKAAEELNIANVSEDERNNSNDEISTTSSDTVEERVTVETSDDNYSEETQEEEITE